MSTDTTRPYTAMIPDMTTGMSDWMVGMPFISELLWSLRSHTFMMSSGLNVPRPAIPMPALDVPNAAPTATNADAQMTVARDGTCGSLLLNIICAGGMSTVW